MFQAYQRLRQKLDDSVAVLEKLHVRHLVCKSGCAACCQHILTFYRVEVDAVIEYLNSLDADQQQKIIAQLKDFRQSERQAPCPMLVDGKCLIYPARPLLCRSHGLLFNTSEVPGLMQIEKSCDLNYRDADISKIPTSETLNQKLLSLLLIQVNGLYCAGTEADASARYELTDLIDLMKENENTRI